MSLRPTRLTGAFIAACALGAGLVLATPAAAATPGAYDCVIDSAPAGAPAGVQPLRVCASFNKSAYRSSDVITVTESVTNLGSATAADVALPLTDSDQFRDWQGFSSSLIHPGLDIPAGATVIAQVHGYAGDPGSGAVVFSSQATQQNGYSFGPDATISAPVTAVTASYSGTVFADANGNGVPDSGEGTAGVQVTLTGPFEGIDNETGPQNYTATTDGQGHFTFANLPGGVYFTQFTAPGGWVVTPPSNGEVTVDGSAADTNALFPATPSVAGTLHATMSFDQAGYQVGDSALLTVNLTNSGSTAIDGVQTRCDPGDVQDYLPGLGNDWSAFNASGVDVPAGQTVTVHLSERIPVADTGPFQADCLFGPNVVDGTDNYPTATATATVSPASHIAPQFSVEFVNDEPLAADTDFLPDTELLDPATQDPMLPPGTGQQLIEGLPTGTYDIALTGQWAFAPGQSDTIDTAALTSGETVVVHLVPTNPQPAPPSAPPVLHTGNPVPVSPRCGTSVCLY